MKNLLITYNTIFFLLGNVLISNSHHFDHDHDSNHNNCEECIIIENGNNCLLDLDEVNFSNNNSNEFVCKFFNVIERYIEKAYLSRAPPIS